MHSPAMPKCREVAEPYSTLGSDLHKETRGQQRLGTLRYHTPEIRPKRNIWTARCGYQQPVPTHYARLAESAAHLELAARRIRSPGSTSLDTKNTASEVQMAIGMDVSI